VVLEEEVADHGVDVIVAVHVHVAQRHCRGVGTTEALAAVGEGARPVVQPDLVCQPVVTQKHVQIVVAIHVTEASGQREVGAGTLAAVGERARSVAWFITRLNAA